MKYELTRFTDAIKNDPMNLYENSNGKSCLNLTWVFIQNPKRLFPIALFINGLLFSSNRFSFDKATNILTVNENGYKIIPDDDIYVLLLTNDEFSGGYLKNITITDKHLDGDSQSKSLKTSDLSKYPYIKGKMRCIVAISINGVVYHNSLFSENTQYQPNDRIITTITLNENTDVYFHPEDIITFILLTN